jgi:hypothetical protein
LPLTSSVPVMNLMLALLGSGLFVVAMGRCLLSCRIAPPNK